MTETTTDIKSNRFRWFTAAVIVLMIVLMVFSSNTVNRQSRMDHGVLVGKATSGDVMSQDSQYASGLFEELQSVVIVIPSSAPNSMPQTLPLLFACWGEPVMRDVKAHPEALFLALREARLISPGANPYALGSLEAEQQSPEQLGIFNSGQVTVGDLRPLPTSPLGGYLSRIRLSTPFELRVVDQGRGRSGQYSPASLPPLDQARLYAAMTDFLTLQAAASLPLNALKPTTPMVDRLLAERFQTFSLQVAAIDAQALIAKVPDPTDDQLRVQLTTYAANVPGRPDATNGFGFGYRVPDRVKLELISFKRADVRRVIEAEKTPYEWEVAARIAYAEQPASFVLPAPPSSQPTSQPDASASTQPAATSFEANRGALISAVIDRAIDVRTLDIERAIRSPMTMDYQMWANANAAPKPGAASVPTNTTFSAAYNSPDYLQKLAAGVEAKFKVRPTVELYTDRFRDAAALSLLGGFNNATRAIPDDLARRVGRTSGLVSGPEYALGFAKDLRDAPSLEMLGGLVLDRYRPSERLESRRAADGSDREIFFFRITDVDKNHPGTEIEEVRERLKSDWRVAQAQKLANDQAAAAVAAIDGGTDFNSAVTAAAPGATFAQAVVGPFVEAPSGAVPLDLSLSAYAQFGARLTERLLAEKPSVAVLDVPLAGKAYVAKRLSMGGTWTDADQLRDDRLMLRAMIGSKMTLPASDANIFGMSSADASASWLDSKQVFERNGYKPSRDDTDSK